MIYLVYLNPTVDKTIYFDKFEIGKTNRPVKIVEDGAGKAINVAVVLSELGARACCIGFIYDKDGKIITDRLNDYNVEYDFITVNGTSRVNTKIFDEHCGVITEINESGLEVSQSLIDEIFKKTINKCKKSDIFILTGSLPKGCSKDIYAKMTKELKSRGAMVVLDADEEVLRLGVAEKPFFIKPNIDEIKAIEEMVSDDFNDVCACAKGMAGNKADIIGVSMGGNGAVISDGKDIFFAPPLKLEIKSTVGAGDSMVAGIVYGINSGFTIDMALKYGIACASCSITKEGTKLADRTGIEEFLRRIEVKKI